MHVIDALALGRAGYYERFALAMENKKYLQLNTKEVKKVLVRDTATEIKRSYENGGPTYLQERLDHTRYYRCNKTHMIVSCTLTPYDCLQEIVTTEPEWPAGLHVAFSYPNRLPTWDELKAVKLATFGPDLDAMQVIPREEVFYSFHDYCLHLWDMPFKWQVVTP